MSNDNEENDTKEKEELERRREESLEVIRNFREYQLNKLADRQYVEVMERFAQELSKVPKCVANKRLRKEEIRKEDLREMAACEAAKHKNVIVFENVIVRDPSSG